jgi:signal peptidase I
MAPTLKRADRILANKLAYRGDLPSRGDVIVFPSSSVALGAGVWPEVLVKRVVGLPGDRIEMEDGSPMINGWKVPFCDAGQVLYVLPDDGLAGAIRGRLRVEFLGSKSYATLVGPHPPSPRAPVTVAAGEVFVLGDNRSNSLDSRAWNGGLGGGVPAGSITGRADWFLVGTHRSGETDWSRLLRPLDRLQSRVQIEDFNGEDPRSELQRCLSERPAETVAPLPGAPTAP